MRIHKDNIRTFAISILSIVAVALLGFWVAGVFLSPKQISTTDPSYRAKATYPSDPITLTYWRTVDGDQRTAYFKSSKSSTNLIAPELVHGASTAMWARDHAITSLTLLREAISDSEEVDEAGLLEGDRGIWIAEFALQSAYWLSQWASVGEDSESE